MFSTIVHNILLERPAELGLGNGSFSGFTCYRMMQGITPQPCGRLAAGGGRGDGDDWCWAKGIAVAECHTCSAQCIVTI